MKRSDIQTMPANYDRYISLVEDIDLYEAFDKGLQQLNELDIPRLLAVGSAVYAPGKWTIHDIFRHAIDTERVFAYRALRFARNDQTSLPGFDQVLFAANAEAEKLSLDELLSEFKVVRQSSIMLFHSFSDAALLREGVCSGIRISVLAIGFAIVGHQMHHLNIIREKYFPLIKQGSTGER